MFVRDLTKVANLSITHRTRQISTSCLLRSQDDQLKVFKDNATKWWNGKEFAILRSMNEIRVPFITKGIDRPMNESKILDVGCGGGILSEPLARLGANVLGIDPVFESINQAQLHSQTDEHLKSRLKYLNCNIEDLSPQSQHVEAYDAVVASEVLEHIEDVENFLVHCTKLIKPHGSLFITTINQTPLSWLGVIFMGEYVLQQLPKGTHSYDLFVSVKGLRVMLERLGYHIRLVNGFMYEPFGGKFYWTPTSLTHYALQAVKTVPIAKNLNHQQKRYMAKANLSKKLQRPKVLLDSDEMNTVIPYDTYQEKANLIISNFKSYLENDLTTRATTSSIEKLKINLETTNEPLELRDIAQITMKGNNLIVINLSLMPEAVKPTMDALTKLGNTNPQSEVNNIYVPIARVTREFRESLVSAAKQNGSKAKDNLRSLFSDFSSKAKKPGSKLPADLVHNTVENLQFDMNKRLNDIDSLLQKKISQLLN